MKTVSSKTKTIAYLGIFFVVFAWGVFPVLTTDILSHYSGGIYTFISSLVSAIALLLISIPKLKLINADYFKVAIPTGFFVGFANLLQKIGLQYTTPTMYAFLENLSCVIVPILLFLFIRKKPGILSVTAAVICLSACFILSGLSLQGEGMSFGKGDILCALAGILYGVNIAATGVYAKKLNAMLYVMIQMWVNVIIAGAAALLLNNISLNGNIIEPIKFEWSLKYFLYMAFLVLSISTLGWIIRTQSLKFVNPCVVAVIMPFSSVVTGIIAVMLGKDAFSLKLLFGGLLIIISSILSGFDDICGESVNKAIFNRNKDEIS